MTNFEEYIRNKLEEYRVINTEPDWNIFENKLAISERKKQNNIGFILAAAIGLIAGITFIYSGVLQKNEVLPIPLTTKIDRPDSTKNIIKIPNIDAALVKNTNKVKKDKTKKDNSLATKQKSNQENIISPNSPEILITENRKKLNIGNSQLKSEKEHKLRSKALLTHKKPQKVTVSKTVACINEEIQFSTNDRCNCNYKWDFGDGEQNFDKMPVHTYEVDGAYKVAVTITDKETHKTTFAYRADIKVIANPISDFEFTPPNLDKCEIDHNFTALNPEMNQLIWTINNREISQNPSFNYLLQQKGEYDISLITTNNSGCKNTTTKTIFIIRDFNLGAASGFIPSFGDLWLPKYLTCLNNKFSLAISSLKGKIVFQTNTIDKKWDGTIIGTSKIAQKGDTFIWTATYTDNNGINRKAKGAITIVGN